MLKWDLDVENFLFIESIEKATYVLLTTTELPSYSCPYFYF